MVPALFLFASLVNDVRGLIAGHDFAGAERGSTPQVTQDSQFGEN